MHPPSTKLRVGALLVLVGLGSPAPELPALSTLAFRGAAWLPAGAPQAWAAAGDLDADGRDDLVLLRASGAGFAVLLSRDGGRFDLREHDLILDNGIHAAVGRLDADPFPDLSIAVRGGVRLLRGRGDGSFDDWKTLRTIFVTREVLLGDIDGDARADLAAADEIAGVVRIFLGDGAGGFIAAGDYPPGGEPHDIELADVTGDGRADIVASFGNLDLVSVLAGRGGGEFSEPRSFAAGRNNRFLDVGRLNADALVDVVLSSQGSSSAIVLLSLGGSRFVEPRSFATLESPEDVAIADADGDGVEDLVLVGSSAPGRIAVHRGDGAGAFDAPRLGRLGRRPYNLARGAFTGAGGLELAAANAAADFASLVRIERGEAVLAAEWPAPAGVLRLDAADLDGDSEPDLAVILRNALAVTLYFGDGRGGVRRSEALPLDVAPQDLVAGDFDADGRPDLAVAGLPGAVVLFRGAGGGAFEEVARSEAVLLPARIAGADLDGDGADDLAVADGGAGELLVFLSGAGGLSAAPLRLAAGARPADVAIGDLDASGAPDLVAVNAGSQDAALFFNDGRGGFARRRSVALGFSPGSAALGDADGNGLLDLACADAEGHRIALIRDAAVADTEREPELLPSGAEPAAVVFADLAGADGRDEIVVAARFDGAVFVHENDGAGSYRRFQAWECGAAPADLAIADLDGDGAPDIAAADSVGRAVAILFAEPPAGPRRFRRGDVTGEGGRDISDPIAILNFLFLGGRAIDCLDAADANDDGAANIADGVFLLGFLFLGGPAPPEPWDCGEDPGEDGLAACSGTCR